jgi:transposase
MKHIGLDLSSTSIEACVLNARGIRILSRRIRSREKDMVEFVRSIPGPKRVVIEESQMADWVARCLIPHVDELIRCQPQHNRLISESENKHDKQDALSLAELLFMNKLKPVHHPDPEFRNLRELVRAYWLSSAGLTRAKNQLKSFFLFNGLHCVGEKVYSSAYREHYLSELRKRSGNTELAKVFFKRVEHAREAKAAHILLLRKGSKGVRRELRVLKSIPGIGFIGAITLVAYLERGWRFRNKRKLWRYSGLALRRHETAGKGTRSASREGNRHVKNVLMTAVASLATRDEDSNALTKMIYQGLRQGIDPDRVRRNLARKIVVLAQCFLRSKQEYDDGRVAVSM